MTPEDDALLLLPPVPGVFSRLEEAARLNYAEVRAEGLPSERARRIIVEFYGDVLTGRQIDAVIALCEG